MVLGSAWAQTRYQWTSGTGVLAALRQAVASAPGRRFAHRTLENQVSLAYLGFPEGLTYVVPYLGEQLSKVAGPVEALDAAPLTWRDIRRTRADIVATGCSRRRAHRLPSAHSVVLPFRVQLLLRVIDDAEAMRATITRDERRKFAKLRRANGWTCEIGRDDADFDFFYERMHHPTMRSRHGERTRSVARDVALHGLFRQGFVFFIREDGERVAGVLCRLDDGDTTMRLRLLGVLDGAEEHYRSGAAKAVYHLGLEWAAGNGIRLLDLAGADPFPGVGVFQYKRRFHPEIRQPLDHYRDRRVHLRITTDSPRVRDFLAATPMISVDAADRLAATYFHDRARPARTDIRADGPGIDYTRVIDLDEFLAGLPVSPFQPLAGQVIAG
jgi:hypothetical protein